MEVAAPESILDGSLIRFRGPPWLTPVIETGSGYKTLDDAAVAAIVASAPFEQFPEAFKGPNVELRVIFLYNVTLPER